MHAVQKNRSHLLTHLLKVFWAEDLLSQTAQSDHFLRLGKALAKHWPSNIQRSIIHEFTLTKRFSYRLQPEYWEWEGGEKRKLSAWIAGGTAEARCSRTVVMVWLSGVCGLSWLKPIPMRGKGCLQQAKAWGQDLERFKGQNVWDKILPEASCPLSLF